METINITKKRFESLACYDLPNYVFNTEGTLYVLPIKSRWDTKLKLLKRLYLTNGNTFGNKLQTINSLIDNKEELDIEEIVFPENDFVSIMVSSFDLYNNVECNDNSNEYQFKIISVLTRNTICKSVYISFTIVRSHCN